MGLAKSNKNICYSFCGTDEYLSPEMILGNDLTFIKRRVTV